MVLARQIILNAIENCRKEERNWNNEKPPSKKFQVIEKYKLESSNTSKESSTEKVYNSLITEARFIPGDDSDIVPLEEIPWVNKSLVNESGDFHRKFFALVILSNTSALMYGFAIKPNSSVLLRTGKLHDPELSFRRYLSTIQRIGKFFTLPFDGKQAYKAFRVVRKMHALASKMLPKSHPTPNQLKLDEPWKTELAMAIRKDLEFYDTRGAPHHALTWDPPVAVSQFDMAITQLGFWGTIYFFPRLFGVKNREEEMEGVIHMWAIFGRLLGIRDEFNICLHNNPRLFEKLYKNVVVESLKTVDETVITLQSTFMEAFSKRMPFITYKAFLFLGFQEWEGFKGDNIWKLMSWKDKASLRLMEILLWMLRNCGLFRVLVNLLFGIWLQIQFWVHLPNILWPAPQYIYHEMK